MRKSNLTCHGVSLQFKDQILSAPWRIHRNLKHGRFVLLLFVLSLLSVLTACVAATATGSSFALDHERRTFPEFMDDRAISMRTSLALAKDKELWRHSHIDSITYNGTLLLVGQTPTHELNARAEEIAVNNPDVKRVFNEITVRQPISVYRRTQDSWITAQIKTKYITTHDIGPSRVKVITENGIVYLMGILTKDEAYIAKEIARKTPGVKEVKTLFEPAQI